MKVALKITPNAKKSRFVGMQGGVLHVKIAAPAVDGRANAELVRFLAECLSVPRSRITILRGGMARIKLVELPDEGVPVLLKYGWTRQT